MGAGRPKVSELSRAEQLRRAKRAQRDRERRRGLRNVQLVLPERIADKLAVARAASDFPDQLEAALDRIVIRVDDFPQLRDLAWNRVDAFEEDRARATRCFESLAIDDTVTLRKGLEILRTLVT